MFCSYFRLQSYVIYSVPHNVLRKKNIIASFFLRSIAGTGQNMGSDSNW